MSKKKRFGISEALTRGLSETINVVENNLGVFRNVVLPLSRVELDPDNPRKLLIDLLDVKEGLRPDDANYHSKQVELEKLKELAHTIKTNGIINPVVVYKCGEFYRVVAGERRCMASLLAGKQEIEARVFNDKPKPFDLKLIQWVENTAREDLTLFERLGNVRDIIKEYQQQHKSNEMNATLLKNITGLSLSQTSYYLAVLNAPEDLQLQIENGNIRNLDKAALLASITSPDVRREAIHACVNGASLKIIRSLVSQQRALTKNHTTAKIPRGKSNSKVAMGATLKVGVIKIMIESVLSKTQFSAYKQIFSEVNWVDLRQATKAFRKLIEILERETT